MDVKMLLMMIFFYLLYYVKCKSLGDSFVTEERLEKTLNHGTAVREKPQADGSTQ